MIRTRHTAALAVGLVLVAGCSAGEQPDAAPREQPPSRALVAWSDTVCANVKVVDDLRSNADSSYYTMHVRSDVDSVLAELGELESSGVKQADTYVSGLTRKLERLREQLPAHDAAKQPGKARVTALVDRLGRQGPELARLAGRSRALAPSYHLAPGCTPLKRPPGVSTGATRKLVRWADTMCEGLASIKALPQPGDELLKDPRFARFENSELSSYLTSVPSQVRSIVEPLARLPKAGIADADAYRSSLLAGLRDAGARLPREESALDLYDVPIERLRARAQRAAGIIAAITPEGPGLRGIAREHSAFGDAYHLAPQCTPPGEKRSAPATTTPPPARDGKNVTACQDGTCQIEVSAPVDVTVRGNVFTVAVSDGTVWIVNDSSLIRLAGLGTGRFGVSGTTVTFSIKATTDTTTVLDISTD